MGLLAGAIAPRPPRRITTMDKVEQQRERNGRYDHEWAWCPPGEGPMTTKGVQFGADIGGNICYHCGKPEENDLQPGERITRVERARWVRSTRFTG
jgi:hypothetical protein